MEQTVTQKIEVHPYQYQLLSSNKRFLGAIAGIQSGKTYTGCMWLRDRILEGVAEQEEKRARGEEFIPYDYLIAAPTYKVLQQSTLKKFFDLIPPWLGDYKEEKSVFVLKKGGNVFIRSTEDPNTIEGMTLKAAWLDEAGMMKDAVWNIVYGRLNIQKGRCMITTTPYTFNWVYDEFISRFDKGDPDFLVVTWESQANPWFPKEEYDRAQATMDSYEFDRRYRGLLRQRRGLVYEDWNPARMVWDRLPDGFHVKEYVAGVDFGYNHPSAIEVIGYSDDKPSVVVMDEWQERGKTIDDVILVCKILKLKYNITAFYADPSRPEYIKMMMDKGIPVYKANNDTEKIDTVRTLMKTGNFYVLKKAESLLAELRTYHYPEEGVKIDDPVKEKDDACDAMRYAVASFTYSPVITNNSTKPLSETWQFIKEGEQFEREKGEHEFEEAIDSFIQDGVDFE